MRWWVRVLGGLATVAALVAVVVTFRSAGVEDVQAAVRDAGPWAPLWFVLLQVAVTAAPVPRTVFTLAAGVLFGSATGVVVAVVATVLTAVLAFALVRVAGRSLLQRWAGRPGMRWLRARLDRSGTLAVASLRLIPPLPFSVTNYAAGISGVRFSSYLLGTTAGVLPGTVALVVLGDAVTGRPSLALLAVSVSCGIIGLIGAAVAVRRPLELESAPASS